MQLVWKTIWQFLKMLNIQLHDPAILILGIFPREIKTYVHTKTYTTKFIATLFIMAQMLEQLKCLSIDEETKSDIYLQWNIIQLREKCSTDTFFNRNELGNIW